MPRLDMLTPLTSPNGAENAMRQAMRSLRDGLRAGARVPPTQVRVPAKKAAPGPTQPSWVEVRPLPSTEDDPGPYWPEGPDAPVYWVGVTVFDSELTEPLPPDDGEVTAHFIGTYEHSSAGTKYVYWLEVTGEEPHSDYVNALWLKCNLPVAGLRITGRVFTQHVEQTYPAVPPGGPPGPFYDGPYTIAASVNADAQTRSDVAWIIGTAEESADIFDVAGGFTTFNGETIPQFIPTFVIGDFEAAIGPVVNPAVMSMDYVRYHDAGGQPEAAATAFVAVVRVRVSR